MLPIALALAFLATGCGARQVSPETSPSQSPGQATKAELAAGLPETAPEAQPVPTPTPEPVEATPAPTPEPVEATPTPTPALGPTTDQPTGGRRLSDLKIITLLPFDAIPAILEPKFLSDEEAREQYAEGELILGVSINSDHRAYSVPYLSSREIVNDVVGRVPIAVTW
jgi:hypothetical protein